MPRYIVSGSNIIDRIKPFEEDKPITHAIGGGVNYALSAMNIFGEDILNVSYAGADFDKYYLDWYRANGFSDQGVVRAFEKTYRTTLNYGPDGTYTTAPDEGENKFGRNTPNLDLVKKWLDGPDIKGAHFLAHVHTVFFEQLQQYRQKGIKIGLEMEVLRDTYVDIIEVVDRVVELVDYFSISLSEAKRIWPDVKKADDALKKMADFPCAVFFRMGTDGAYMIKDGIAWRSPLVSAFGDVDPTGCGNSSTAAAFVALCEGRSPQEAGICGAVAASLAASQHGFVPKLTPELKKECNELVTKLMQSAEEGIRI